MSNPTASDVHVDAALSDLAIGVGAQQYVWDQLAPVVPVDKQSDKFHIYTADDFRRDEIQAARAAGELAGRGEFGVSDTSYYCQDWSWGKQTPDEVGRNADAALRIGQNSTLYCTEVVNRRIELQWASKMFVTGVWDRDITGAAADAAATYIYWSTPATSAPIQNVRAEADTIQANTGQRPNRLALGREVLSTLLDHPDIIDRMPAGVDRIVQLQFLAALFEVDQIVVGAASYNTTAKGLAAVNAFIWGKSALLYYVPPTPSVDMPSAMYSFRWGPRSTLNYRDTPPGKMADVIEVHDYVDLVICGAAYGTFFSAIIE